MVARTARLALLLIAATRCTDAAVIAANPVRKVVAMLQSMQRKVTAEGEKEKELYDKFVCYCSTSEGNLGKSIAAAEAKIPSVSSDIETAEAKRAQLQEELKQAQADRTSAKAALQEATALREKEHTSFVAEQDEYVANIGALGKAVAALEKGMAGAFLQTDGKEVLLRLARTAGVEMLEEDRQILLSFLSGKQDADYAPQSGQIVGLLKQLGDSMATSLAGIVSAEEKAVHVYGELSKAKTKEINALTNAIETKSKKIGELAVDIVEMKDDLDDTQEVLLEDKAFLAELDKGCDTKKAEWEERSKTRVQELAALADTIKILNDDDALELFKKTLPAPSASFVQVRETAAAIRKRALSTMLEVRHSGRPQDNSKLGLIALALTGKKVDFSKVVSMIDDMVTVLKDEQNDDDDKKEYCETQFDLADDKRKALEDKLEDETGAIEAATTGIATLKEEIAALEAGIQELDKSVAEATQQRKDENDEYKELIAQDTAAKELLSIAKNRLNKFYNPSLYNPPPKTELSAEDRIVSNMGNPDDIVTSTPPGGIAGTGVTVLAQVSAHRQREAPAPPPETFGAYSKKGEEGTGVIAMIDLLVKDLSLEMTEAETEEKESQAEYETTMKDSALKRASDSKSYAQKEGAKANMEADLEAHKGEKRDDSKRHMAVVKYITQLHAECDWLIQYYSVRKEARSGELDSLANAKAVLSGASLSLLETSSA